MRSLAFRYGSLARHKFAFVPFGGGAQMCLGLNFAYIQAKCFTWHFLNRFRVAMAPNYRPALSGDGFDVVLTPA